MMNFPERRDELTHGSENAQISAFVVIAIGILIELFGAGAMLGMLGAAAKNASSTILGDVRLLGWSDRTYIFTLWW